MRSARIPSLAALALLGTALARPALADDPKFVYGTQEETKGQTVWKASVNVGLVLNTGNANSLAFSGGGTASVNDGNNRAQLDLYGSYAQSTTVTPVDANGNGQIDPGELQRTTATTAAIWGGKLRYDRFLTTNNSLYAAGFATGNQPAGINVATGVQAGYSRQLIHREMHLLVAELGYDFTYQNNVSGPDLTIHSARGFVGYTLTLSKEIAVAASVEVLCNLNSLPGYTGNTVDPFGDTRVNGSASLNAKVWKNIAFQLSFLAKYTTDPAPLPKGMLPFAPGYVPLAQNLDTVTSLSLVVTLL